MGYESIKPLGPVLQEHLTSKCSYCLLCKGNILVNRELFHFTNKAQLSAVSNSIF